MRSALFVWMTLFAGILWAEDTSVSNFLSSAFSPQRAPERKTMGLLQRSFLDLVEDAQPKLQVALVIDGTDSMTDALNGVRNAFKSMANDLKRYRDQVDFQLVVYRDIDSKSGAIQFPLNLPDHQFTSNTDRIIQALKDVQPESGAPYFHELVDLGIHDAIDKLDWSDDKQTTKWILVFGDAPPFDENWKEEETNSSRRYSNDRLVTLARSKNIRISSVLCVSSADVKKAYDSSLRASRQFMTLLANETDGLMLDLSYDNIREALLKASKAPDTKMQAMPMEPISRDNIQSVRDLANANRMLISPDRQTRLAILPYMPLDQLSFDSDHPQVQFVSELRYKFRQIPGVSVKTPRQVEEIYETLTERGYKDKRLLMAIANKLRVDYILWGEAKGTRNPKAVTPIVFTRSSGKGARLQAVTINKSRSTAGFLADRVLRSVTVPNEMIAQLDKAQDSMLRLVSTNGKADEPLMGAFDALEKCVSYKVGSDAGNRLARQAKNQLDRAIETADDNALAHYLLTNYHFNQAQARQLANQPDEAKKEMRQFAKSLRAAYKYRTRQSSNELRQEITALNQLLIKKDVAAAIKSFEELTGKDNDVRLHFARRAHWMLAGIYAGDWGIEKKFVDAGKAREHLVKILAFFEDSPEAEFIRNALRWDGDKTNFKYLPLSNSNLTDLIDT